ncbi:MAG TPA: hypothetical protein VGL19_19730 [Polyangiaceae bacterium]
MAFAQVRCMAESNGRGNRALALLALPLLATQGYFVTEGVSALLSAREPAAQRSVEVRVAAPPAIRPTLAACAVDAARVRNVFDSSDRSIAVVQVTGRRHEGTMREDIVTRSHQLSDTQFMLERSVIEALLNEAETMRGPRIVFNAQGPRAEGIVLVGIRRDTLLAALGLRNGDWLKTLNGCGLATPEDALEAYAQLRRAPNLRLAVSREGSPLTLDYSIQ